MSSQKTWSSNYVFLLASIGSTVGLSNIWKFTYLAGENGGGAFVLVYVLSLMIMGVPILAAEMVIGKRGEKSMVGTLQNLAKSDGLHQGWKYFGWVAMVTVFLILSFYCVIAGWTLDYTITSLAGSLNNLNKESAAAFYQQLLDSPFRMMLGQGIFVLATTWIVAKGVQDGLEKSVGWMMPTLFVILLLLVLYGAIFGELGKALQFLFAPDFSKLTPSVVLAAFGQAFFSLGIGVGVMLTYGAYMPPHTNVLKSSAIIAFSDGAASILAGLAIFPIVFQYGLSPAEGPGLIFVTLPMSFAEIPGGGFIGAFFFLLLFFAALTSSISLLESIISHLEETLPYSRARITWVAGVLLWLIGLVTVFSFSSLKDFAPLGFIFYFEGKTIFELIDYFGSNVLMPLGGILMALLAGWLLNKKETLAAMNVPDTFQLNTWHALIKYIVPLILIWLWWYLI
ncbi:MAG: sodium-dependent transporter [Bacteroidetes bacterium]|nr:sodium-dependent transporter [Bacteroidota bacterium]